MIAIRIHDKDVGRGEKPETLKFKTFTEAANHARLVIAPQIADQIDDLIQEDDPKAWIEDIRWLTNILAELYSADEERVTTAIQEWMDQADDINAEYWVEWVG